jgi:hypothetical protein
MEPMEGLRAAMAAVDACYKERGIFQGRFGFGLRPALVVIDMAYGWTDPAYAGGSERLDMAIAALQKLMPAARAKRVPITYTTSSFSETPQLKSAADFSPNYRRWDRRACELDERLRRHSDDYVLAKEHASAFAGTPLIGHLVERHIDTLLITGCYRQARRKPRQGSHIGFPALCGESILVEHCAAPAKPRQGGFAGARLRSWWRDSSSSGCPASQSGHRYRR